MRIKLLFLSLLILTSRSFAQLEETKIDLERFRTYALKAITPYLDGEKAEDKGVWFQDGAGPLWEDFSTPAECVLPSFD